MLHLHEVHKLVYDLIERQAFELAHQIAGLYMDPFDRCYRNLKRMGSIIG